MMLCRLGRLSVQIIATKEYGEKMCEFLQKDEFKFELYERALNNKTTTTNFTLSDPSIESDKVNTTTLFLILYTSHAYEQQDHIF